MRRAISKITVSALLLVGTFMLFSSMTRAEHDDFEFKWPYLPGVNVGVTGYPYTAHHGCPPGPGKSCTDAWDITIPGDQVISSAEGVITEATSNLTPGTCGPSLGLGNNVKVSISGGPTIYYAHLSSTSLVAGNRVYQGDLPPKAGPFIMTVLPGLAA